MKPSDTVAFSEIPKPKTDYERIVDASNSLLGIVETSENCSPEIEQWAKRHGLKCPVYWCGLAASEAHYIAGVKAPKSAAWVPAWFPKSRIYWRTGDEVEDIRIGTEVGYWFKSLNRPAHIGIATGFQYGAVIVNEGNATKDKHTRNGTVHIAKFRQSWEIWAAADWVE